MKNPAKLLCIIVAVYFSTNIRAQQTPNHPQVNSILKHLESKKSSNPVLSNDFAILTERRFTKNTANNSISSFITKEDMVKIVARSPEGDTSALQSELQLLGMKEAEIHGTIINGWLPVSSIQNLENCKFLKYARPEKKPATNLGLADNEADIVMNTGTIKRLTGLDGSGIKIGILSNSYDLLNGAADGVRNGDLPGSENPNGYTSEVMVLSEIRDNINIAVDEGRAMAELIHDLVPGAEIYFYSAFNGFFDFADGIRTLAAAGCDIIVDDVFYFESPFYQDGAIAKAVDEVNEQGVAYFSAALNLADNGYDAPYNSIDIGENKSIHDFGNFTDIQITVPSGGKMELYLHWDDPSILAGSNSGNPDTDLEIFLFDNETGDLIQSEKDNIISGEAFDNITMINETSTSKTFDVTILKQAGPDPGRIRLMSFGSGSFQNLPADFGAPTIFGHSNAAGAITVGASNQRSAPEFSNSPYAIESFSSLGGIPILFDGSGNRISPIIRQKPDVVGPDAVSTSFFGRFGRTFIGTSAAAPNVAGVAALLLQQKPELTPEEIRQLLIKSSVDMDDPATDEFDNGFDFKTGFGFVQADEALTDLIDNTFIYRYELTDPTTGEVLQTIQESTVLDLSAPGRKGPLNIQAVAKNSRFLLLKLAKDSSILEFNFDTSAPYSLFKENESWLPNTGQHSLKSISPSPNGLVKYDIDFTITNAAQVSQLLMVDNNSGDRVSSITSSVDKIDLSSLSQEELGNLNLIVRNMNPFRAEIEEVQYKITGPNIDVELNSTQEDFPAFTSEQGIRIPWSPAPVNGTYVIETLTLARAGDLGTKGIEKSFEFEIIGIENDLTDKAPETLSEDMFKIYPNPINNDRMVNLSVTNNLSIQQISVYNGVGAKLATFSQKDKDDSTDSIRQINLSGYAEGIYFLQAIDQNGIKYDKKIIIQ